MKFKVHQPIAVDVSISHIAKANDLIADYRVGNERSSVLDALTWLLLIRYFDTHSPGTVETESSMQSTIPNGFKDLEADLEPDLEDAECEDAEDEDVPADEQPEIANPSPTVRRHRQTTPGQKTRRDEIIDFVAENPGLRASDLAKKMVAELASTASRISLQVEISKAVQSGEIYRSDEFKIYPIGDLVECETTEEAESDGEQAEPEIEDDGDQFDEESEPPQSELESIEESASEPEIPPPVAARTSRQMPSQIESFERRLAKKQSMAFPDRQPTAAAGSLDLICEFIRSNGASSADQIAEAVFATEHAVKKAIESHLTMFVPSGRDRWDLHPNMRSRR